MPVLPDEYFKDLQLHIRPRKDASAQQRYDTAVKVLIRDCTKQSVRARTSLTEIKRTGSFYLFLQTREMADLYRHFGHQSILFMDSGFRVNRNAFPITFISILDNFMKGRMVGVMVSQFTDEHTYTKCLSELRRGDLDKIEPQCSMTDFDTSEISAFRNVWSDIVCLICTFHAVSGQNKWIDKNAPKKYREKLKDKFKALHFASDSKDLKKKMASLKRFCTSRKLVNVKKYLQQS